MLRKALTAIALAGAVLSPAAQPSRPAATAQKQKKSFEEFRQGVLSDYKEFRQTLLDHYADFLNGEWHPYESHNGEKRDKKPKPKSVPVAKPESKTTPKQDRPTVPAPVTELVKEAAPAMPGNSVPEDVKNPAPASAPHRRGAETFSFYGLPVQIPAVEFNISQKLYANNDYAAQWRSLDDNEVADRLLPALQKLRDDIGLNDYLTFQLAKAYIDKKFASHDATARMAAVHYLLAHMGYDARIATTGDGVPLLLIPFDQTIYARTFMMMDGQKYYVFEPEGFSLAAAGPQSIMTCRLPDNVDRGKKMDLRLGKLNVPEKPKKFEFECGPIHLQGEVNENLMPILYHYPQMPVGGFAVSNVQPELREDLARQMRSQLEGLDTDAKVAALLKFMHTVFDYSTDEDFHGFEKPYFLEETLYYPKNDCEDRAIFYTWFLWNALDRDAQLVSFPGHEAATVELENPVEGKSWKCNGKTYYISDPTFIGSRTGQIMPPYRDTPPKVDYTYSDE